MAEADLFHNQLQEHIISGEIANVLSLLKDEDPCCFVGKNKLTLLHLAAEHGNENLAQYLINLGANVNAQNNFKETPLGVAVRSEHKNIVGMLLKANADICIPDIFEKSVFDRLFNKMDAMNESIRQMIIDSIAYTIINKLLSGNAYIGEIGSKRTTLRNAIEQLDQSITKFLIQYDNKYEEKEKPLALEIVKVLINEKDKWIDYESIEVLMLALLSSEELKGVKFDVNVSPKHKKTLLHRVAKYGNASLVKLLLQRGAEVDAKDYYNRTPLYMVAYPLNYLFRLQATEDVIASYNIILLLLDNGADPEIFTQDVEQKYYENFDDLPLRDVTIKLMSPVLMELVLQEALGRPIDQFMLEKIEGYTEYKKIFESSKRELGEMKNIVIDESVTLFDFLIAKKISKYTDSEIFMTNLIGKLEDYNVDSYYFHKLQKQIKKICSSARYQSNFY